MLKKAAAFDIQKICPLHGPVLDKDLGRYIEQYNTWSSYGVESPGVAVAYASVYGHTREAAQKLAQILKDKGCPKVALFDLAREDIYECVEDAFRYGTLVIASPTYNGGAFPAAREFIQHLTSRNYQKRKVAFIGLYRKRLLGAGRGKGNGRDVRAKPRDNFCPNKSFYKNRDEGRRRRGA